jgi:hypothetical protein
LALVPLLVVTRTSTVPLPAGAVAVILLDEITLYVADFVPKTTFVAPVKLEP